MSRILLVADVPWVVNEVHASLTVPDFEVDDLDDPKEAAARVVDGGYDLAVIDLQIGSMGGMAVTRDIRERAGMKGRDTVPVVMLLDRAADAFLAKRAGASAWVTKPFDAYAVRTAVSQALGIAPVATAAEAGSTE
jgi:DNA-binding response OmpR family regulator